MNILVGTGGNQKILLKDPGVAPCHCAIFPEGDDLYIVESTNKRPAYVDGKRIFGDMTVNGDSEIKIGNTISITVRELAEPYEISNIIDWGIAAERFNSITDLDVFQVTVDHAYSKEEINIINTSALKLCRAYFHINQKKFREAQIIIYDVGDLLYENQDGRDILKNAYLSAMILLFYLYKEAGLADLKEIAKNRSIKMINSGYSCTNKIMHLLD